MHSFELAISSAHAGLFGWLLTPSLSVFLVCIILVGIRQFLEPDHRLKPLRLRYPASVSFTLLVLVIGYAYVGAVAQDAMGDIFKQKQSIAPTPSAPTPVVSITPSSKPTPNKALKRPLSADLERQFFDAYAPPDGCRENEIRTKTMLIECANDRGQAKREFMAKHGVGN